MWNWRGGGGSDAGASAGGGGRVWLVERQGKTCCFFLMSLAFFLNQIGESVSFIFSFLWSFGLLFTFLSFALERIDKMHFFLFFDSPFSAVVTAVGTVLVCTLLFCRICPWLILLNEEMNRGVLLFEDEEAFLIFPLTVQKGSSVSLHLYSKPSLPLPFHIPMWTLLGLSLQWPFAFAELSHNLYSTGRSENLRDKGGWVYPRDVTSGPNTLKMGHFRALSGYFVLLPSTIRLFSSLYI